MSIERELEDIIRRVVREEIRGAMADADTNTPEALRMKHDLKQWELAVKAGVSRDTIARYERGEIKKPDGRVIKMIARAMNEDPFKYQAAVMRQRDRLKQKSA